MSEALFSGPSSDEPAVFFTRVRVQPPPLASTVLLSRFFTFPGEPTPEIKALYRRYTTPFDRSIRRWVHPASLRFFLFLFFFIASVHFFGIVVGNWRVVSPHVS